MTPRFQVRLISLASLTLGLGFAASAAQAEAWKFGLLGDTQWTLSGTGTDGLNINSVAVRQILAVNQQFVAQGVKFAIQVGDLGDNGTNASLQTRLDANYALNAAGIPFYGVRGNHEASSAAKTFFKNNYIPANSAVAAVSVAAADAANYVVNTRGVKLFFLDYDVTASTTLMPPITNWIRDELTGGTSQHAFVITHKNLLGQNHKDNFFGNSADANPALQNAFLKVLKDTDVRYFLSGHDHMHHRSYVASPDSASVIHQSIAQSNSSKWYTPAAPFSSRETPVAQQLNNIGYYIYTVDGPRLTGQYFSSVPVNNDVAANPVWTLSETFGYSKNGVSRLVPQGGSHVMTHTIAKGSSQGETGYLGTTMRILAGANTATTKVYDGRPVAKDISVGWAPQRSPVASDVLTIWGMQNALGSDQGDVYVLSLDFDAASRGPMSLVSSSNNVWTKAVSRNFGGNAKFIVGPWKASYALGTYGVDPATRTAWAVVNFGGEFAVARTGDGDLNGDGVIDSRDVAILSQKFNQPATAMPAADLDGDGLITALDARKLALICNLANCAVAAAQ